MWQMDCAHPGRLLNSKVTSKRDGASRPAIANDDCKSSLAGLPLSVPFCSQQCESGQTQGVGCVLISKRFSLKKRYYLILVSRDESGSVRKIPVPLHYAYVFIAVAVIGAFTVTGLAGSYSRMLIKTARFNQLRNDHDTLQKDYAHLEKQAHEKDVQAASLGSLATEVSALYGLTASKLAAPMGHIGLRASGQGCQGCADLRHGRQLYRRQLLQVARHLLQPARFRG